MSSDRWMDKKAVVHIHNEIFSSVQSPSRVWLFVIPWIAAHQASLSITNSQSLTKLMSIESVMPSIHLILCHPLPFLPPIPPSIRVFFFFFLKHKWNSGSFPMSQLFAWGGQSIGVSASASILPMNIQDWSSLGWTGWISLQSKEYYSAIKRNKFETVPMRWMKLESIIQSEVSQKDIVMHMYGI